tara:strand:+ start:1502 stop:1711 length:210 start_codon:yes stop_codon:yes gene_type:complete
LLTLFPLSRYDPYCGQNPAREFHALEDTRRDTVLKPIRVKPETPRSNENAERFVQTLLREGTNQDRPVP